MGFIPGSHSYRIATPPYILLFKGRRLMSLFVLQNQNQYFLTKDQQWEDGRDRRRLFKTTLKDEAVNQLFEANTRDVGLRITIVECDASEQGLPVLDESQLPPLALEKEHPDDPVELSRTTTDTDELQQNEQLSPEPT